MKDVNVPTITPVVALHPTRDLIAGGSSRNIYVWEPYGEEDEPVGDQTAAGGGEARGGAAPSRAPEASAVGP